MAGDALLQAAAAGGRNQLPWPWLYGDAMDVPGSASPRQNAAITQTQYEILHAWAEGRFISDWQEPPDTPSSVDQLPLAERPGMLDRAALEYCLRRRVSILAVRSPGRCDICRCIRSRFECGTGSRECPHRYNGNTLTQEKVFSREGPLFAQGPGDLTRWMGLPWQADTAFCRSGYDTKYDLYQPTFWPARVPNHVLTEEEYRIAVDALRPRDQRIDAFRTRVDWNEPLKGDTAGQMAHMVRIFASMGVLERRSGVSGDPELPPWMWVVSFGLDISSPLALGGGAGRDSRD
jgi:hypothetical protein